MEIVQRQDDIDTALRLPSILLESLLKKRRQEERDERNVDEAERVRNRRAREHGQRVKLVGKRRRRRWDNGMCTLRASRAPPSLPARGSWRSESGQMCPFFLYGRSVRSSCLLHYNRGPGASIF
jgi:hypothetical protein